MTFEKSNFHPYLLFFTSFAVYLFTATPGIYWRDASEFQTIGFLLDIAHPSGSPLYAIVAKLFTLFPLGNIAFKVTLLSAFFGSAIVVLVYLIIQIVLRQLSLETGRGLQTSHRFIDRLSLATTTLSLFSLALWQNATVPEVYTFQNFFTSLSILLILKATVCRSKSDSELRTFKLFLCLTFLFGLSLGAHSILILYLPFLLVFVYFVWISPQALPAVRTWALLSFFFCVGFSIYLYLPIRSTQNPYYDWGDPETFTNLMDHVSDKKDSSYHFSFPLNRMVSQLKLYAGFYFDNFSFLGVVIGGVGLMAMVRRKMYLILSLFALFFLPPFLFFIRWWWEESAFIPNFLIFTVFIAVGIFTTYEQLKGKLGRHPRWSGYSNVAWVLLAFQLVLLVSSHAHQSNKADYWAPRKLMKDILSDLEPNGIVFSGRTSFPFTHLQQSEGYRPDLSLISVASFQAPELFAQVEASKFPDIAIPNVPANQLGSAFLDQNIDLHPIYWEPDAVNNGLVDSYLLPDAFLFKLARDPPALNGEHIRRYLDTLSKQIHFDHEIENYQERLFYALAIVSQGRFFLERGAPETARRHFEMVIELVPDDSQFHNILAISYASLEQYDRAETSFLRALVLSPENISAHVNIANMYKNQGLMEKAEQFYISATEIQPDNLEAIVELGRLYVDRGNRDGAMYYFEKAAKLFPQDKTIRKEIEALNALGKP